MIVLSDQSPIGICPIQMILTSRATARFSCYTNGENHLEEQSMSTYSPEIVELRALRDRRDKKLSVVVEFNKPAWLIDVSVNQGRSELVFDVVFRPYSGQGWIKRRYRYDGEVDVLHHLGEVQFSENELSKLPEEAAIK